MAFKKWRRKKPFFNVQKKRYGTRIIEYPSRDGMFVFWEKALPKYKKVEYYVTRHHAGDVRKVAYAEVRQKGDGIHIEQMDVDPKFEGRGIGSSLHNFIHAQTKPEKETLVSNYSAST